jgi:hypothetical protein
MNIFKQAMLVLALVTQVAPVALAEATFPKPLERKTSPRFRKIAGYAGAGVFGAVAAVSAFRLANMLYVGHQAYPACEAMDGLISIFTPQPSYATRQALLDEVIPSCLLSGGISLAAGILACFSYTKARQASQEEEQNY